MSQRPKLGYEMFTSDASQWPVFLKNQRQLFSFYQDNPEQQLFQLSRIVSPELAKTLLSFSGSENGAAKALQWLHLKYGMPHLQIPKVYEEIRNVSAARAQHDVPKTAEKLLRKVESLSLLMKSFQNTLPSDITNHIF